MLEVHSISQSKPSSGSYAYKAIVGRTEDGKPVFTKALTGKLYEQTADYICSAYINESGQKVAYVIPLDIDAKEKSTSKRWLDSMGRVEWQKVVGFLQKKYPNIFQFLLFVVRSTGGRGIHLGIAISPIVKGFSKQMRRAEFLARQLQKNLLRLFLVSKNTRQRFVYLSFIFRSETLYRSDYQSDQEVTI